MSARVPTRDEAWALLNEFNKSESLIKHALAVEAVMRYMAEKAGENPDEWGIIGLVHDLDYDQFPEQHCLKTRELLNERGWPAEHIRAIMSHGWGLCTDVEPGTTLEKTLYAVDELVGFVTACALVRPSKSVMDMDAKSVQKKWKQKSFAAGVNREVIEKGAAMLGVELRVLIGEVIAAMRKIAPMIGM
jgi:predicted hydrolase (HD superfamily)